MCVGPELLLLVLYMSVAGAAIGTFTGLVPGIHVNTLASIMLVSYPALNSFLAIFIEPECVPICLASCVMAAAVVHSYVDYVPSVFIGAPDPDDVLSMLPGHRLLSEGRGMAAVRSAAIGSTVGACTSIVLALPLQWVLLNGLGDYLDSLTVLVLTCTLVMMILHERTADGCVWATICIVASGAMGLACMDLDIPAGGLFGDGTLLFPLLAGLFGMPSLLQSLGKSRLREQRDDEKFPVGAAPGIKGVITGCLTGWYPGITAATGALISDAVTPEHKAENYISMIASIGTASAVLMLVTLSVSGKGRSGTMLAISDILGGSIVGPAGCEFLLLLFSVAVASFLGYHITIACGERMTSFATKIDSGKLNKACLALVVILVIAMTGPCGLAVLTAATVLGFLPIYAEISRIDLTGCLIIPALLSHMGLTDALLALL